MAGDAAEREEEEVTKKRYGRYIGHLVEVVWLDSSRNDNAPRRRRGKHLCVEWSDFGLLDDETDGVLRLVHSRLRDRPEDDCSGIPVGVVMSMRSYGKRKK